MLLTGASFRSTARAFGLDRDAVRRHFLNHMPEEMRAAAEAAQAGAGPVRLEAIEGQVLLGQAAEVYQRAIDLADLFEDKLRRGDEIDSRSVVAALREVRQALETVAKLSFLVQDRPGRSPESEHPELDAAIVQALMARDFAVEAPAEEPGAGPGPHRVLELEAGS